jgi:hypothetical protein
MAGQIARVLVRSGWRLRCVDPPIAWLQRRDGPAVGVRLQLTCYLTSRFARSVEVKDLRLVLRMGERPVVAKWAAVTDVSGAEFDHEAGYQIVAGEAQHSLAEFVIDDPEAVVALLDPGAPVEAVVQGLLNDAPAYRKLGDLDLIHPEPLDLAWKQIDTGRKPKVRKNNNPPDKRGD